TSSGLSSRSAWPARQHLRRKSAHQSTIAAGHAVGSPRRRSRVERALTRGTVLDLFRWVPEGAEHRVVQAGPRGSHEAVRIDVLSDDDLALERHFEDPSVAPFADQRVAIGQALRNGVRRYRSTSPVTSSTNSPDLSSARMSGRRRTAECVRASTVVTKM